jgi:hypothetical protein
MTFQDFVTQRLLRGLVRRLNNLRIAAAGRRVTRLSRQSGGQPVAFFKASTGIDDLSWNSGFHLLASWALRLKGVPVVYFACRAGMSRCVLGTNRDDVHQGPPCRSCIYQSETLYAGVPSAAETASRRPRPGSAVHWFALDRDPDLEKAIQNLVLEDLLTFAWDGEWAAQITSGASAPDVGPGKQSPLNSEIESRYSDEPMPLGALCLPSVRWILRRHNLNDDENTRFLLREYMVSACNVARQFDRFISETNPRAVVVFNGQYFPEGVARYVAHRRGLRVVTHEVGLQPASAFFTDGEATAYPMAIPDDFELNERQNARLDAYLEQRFQGKFTMAGIQFWPHMRGLGPALLQTARRFSQIVPIFTNVIFDTSQVQANTIFTDMFAWLDMALEVIRSHPETLFVIRAHPDETRLRKESRETVEGWVVANGADGLANVVFVAPQEYLSSYELIQRAKFVMVYNSTVGLEASIMGKPVLCGGRARYTDYSTVFFPQSVEGQRRTMQEFLAAKSIQLPAEFLRNARRFLYFQLFSASLPFDDFLRPSVRPTQARLRGFDEALLVESRSVQAVLRGLLEDGDFFLHD